MDKRDLQFPCSPHQNSNNILHFITELGKAVMKLMWKHNSP